MKRLVPLLSVALILFLGVTAQAAFNGWQTTPVLGIDSSWPGDVLINTGGPTWVNIPHDALDTGTQPIGMTVFEVGQEVHTGSGIYLDSDLAFSAVFTNLSTGIGNQSYAGTAFDPGDGFWMTWNTPDGGGDAGGLPTLTAANVGSWEYTESYTDSAGAVFSQTVPFTVVGAVPEPTTLVVWSLLGLVGAGFGFWRRKK